MAKLTLGEVRKQILAVEAEIKKLDIAYKKLQAGGKDAAQIQKELAKQFDNLTKKITTATNATKRYAQQKTTSAKASQQLNTQLTKTVSNYSKLNAEVNKTTISQSNATKQTKSLGQAFLGTFTQGTVGRIAAYVGIYQLLYGAINAVKQITIGSIAAFIDFEDSIGKLRAVLGANAKETQILSESIRTTAVETRFTATQVTDLATSLAKLGATAEEIPNLILPVALAAQALGASLDEVGETIFKVQNQFGLSSEEAATTAQSLVSAINESALSLGTFNTAIQYVGPIAAQAGLSFSETAGYLQVLADNGFSASRIGTGLRGIFIDIKEAGVPLIDTLQRLADENISVAEATDLVGKRAAAQLITLVDNIDTLKVTTDQTEQFTNSLKASAAQMSTTAGQLDILKSAYEELRISIGDSLISSELFLDVIGLLSIKSEQLARGYLELDSILSTSTGTEVLKENIDILLEGTIDSIGSFDAALQTLKDLGQSTELTSIFDQLESAGLSTAEAQAVLSFRINEGSKATSAYLKNYELTTEQLNIVNIALKQTNDLVENQFNGLRGLQGIVEKEARSIQASNQVREARNQIEEEYAGSLDRVKKLGIGSEASLKKARELQKQINKEIDDANQKLQDASEGYIELSDEETRALKGRISGLKNVKKELSELTYQSEEAEKAATEARKKQLKIDKDAIELRRAEVKEEIRQIKKIRDERIKEIEDRLEREKQAASTVAEAREAEQRAAADIEKANRDAQDALDVTTDKTNKLIDDTTDLQIKYKKDFPDAFDTFALSFEKILFDIQEAVRGTTLSPSEIADSLLGQANTLFVEYEQNLQELKGTFGDTAQGQIDFAEASKQQFEVLKGELDKLLQTYYTYKASLTLILGEDAANEILAPFETTIAIIQNKVNQTGQKAAKASEEIAKKTKDDIQKILVDGLEDALDAAIKALDRFNEVAFENTKDRIEREKEQVEARYELESDILKSQLDNQLITEEEYRARQEKLRKKQIGEENALEKTLFDAQQKRDRQSATSDYLQALASIVPNLIITDKDANPATIALKTAITSAIATASYGAELAAISQRKFIPKKFAEGGFVDGPSHAEGGVPFTVQGRGGYEMEGGEFIVNKRAAQLHRTILERINNSTRIVPQQGKMMFETGGMVSAQSINPATLASQQGSAQATVAQLDYLRAIAETNITISQNTSKPVRAYVSATDLQSNATERKIKERNTKV